MLAPQIRDHQLTQQRYEREKSGVDSTGGGAGRLWVSTWIRGMKMKKKIVMETANHGAAGAAHTASAWWYTSARVAYGLMRPRRRCSRRLDALRAGDRGRPSAFAVRVPGL